MKELLFCLLLLGILPSGFGQQHDYIWVLGEDNGGTTNFIEGNSLDFRINPILIEEESLYLEMHSTMASICDTEGNLQFYTNGCQIANANHQLMENGEGINPGEVHEAQCINNEHPWRGTYTAGYQSALILPLPFNDSIYYLFHKGIQYVDASVITRPFYQTIVNMASNSGQGRVESKNEVIMNETLHFGQLTAVKHANGYDWWIFTPGEKNSNSYHRFLFTSEGVISHDVQYIGEVSTRTAFWANFSTDGKKYARYEPKNEDVFLFDFDRETGLLSNFQQFSIEEEEEWAGGVAFSPNSRFLYVSSFNFIYQFDTWADDIAASRVTIAEYDPLGQLIEQHFWGIQLGPDCRMYVFCNSCDVMHVIHNPDEPGLASNFEQGAVQLPWPIFRSQPHFPNYRLGPVGDEGLPCSPVVSTQAPAPAAVGPRVFPNPARTRVTLAPEGLSGRWVLYDGLGRAVREVALQPNSETTISVEALPAGIYYWSVAGGIAVGKLVKL